MNFEQYPRTVDPFVFDLNTQVRDAHLNVIPKKPKTEEQLDEIMFKCQVYQRVFDRMATEIEKEEDSEQSDSGL